MAFLIAIVCGDAIGQLTRGGISVDGLCTYTFRDVCVSQRMRDVTELRAVVNSLQAQLTLVNKVVAAIPDLTQAMKQLEGKIDDVKDKAQQEAGEYNIKISAYVCTIYTTYLNWNQIKSNHTKTKNAICCTRSN